MCNFLLSTILTLSLAVLHGCMKRLAQGVTRSRIRTNECLGRAQEVALAAQDASTEALTGGGESKASRTCNHPFGGVSGSSMVGVACMPWARCSRRRPRSDPHQ